MTTKAVVARSAAEVGIGIICRATKWTDRGVIPVEYAEVTFLPMNCCVAIFWTDQLN